MFDTNVLVSALLSLESKPSMALARAYRNCQIVISLEVFAELGEVLRRERFRRYVKEETVQAFLVNLASKAEWVHAGAEVSACRDPKDDKFLSLAVSGQATHLISGDRDLLVLDPFQGIRILTPRAFLELP